MALDDVIGGAEVEQDGTGSAEFSSVAVVFCDVLGSERTFCAVGSSGRFDAVIWEDELGRSTEESQSRSSSLISLTSI